MTIPKKRFFLAGEPPPKGDDDEYDAQMGAVCGPPPREGAGPQDSPLGWKLVEPCGDELVAAEIRWGDGPGRTRAWIDQQGRCHTVLMPGGKTGAKVDPYAQVVTWLDRVRLGLPEQRPPAPSSERTTPTEPLDETWTRIGVYCSQGRRSLWMHVEQEDGAGIEAVELRAGREGDDSYVRLTPKNSQWDALLELLLTVRHGATR